MKQPILLLLILFAVIGGSIAGTVATVLSKQPEPSTPTPDSQTILDAARAEADRILAEAETIHMEARKAAAHVELNLLHERLLELNALMADNGESELMLSRFEIQDAKIYLGADGIPEMAITIQNNTDYAVSRAYFKGTLKARARVVPFAEGEFNYQIPGGIEAGEATRLVLYADTLINATEFPTDRDDLEFTATPMRIDDANGKPILDRTHARAFQEEYERVNIRIAELMDLLPGYTPPPPATPAPELPDAADTKPLVHRPEITGNVYHHENTYHLRRECEKLNGAIPSVTKAENARQRRLQACTTCVGAP